VGDAEINAAHRRDSTEALMQSADFHRGHDNSLPAHGAEGEATHEMALDEDAECNRWRKRNNRQRARFTILRSLEADEGTKHRRKSEGIAARQNEGEEEFGPAGNEGEDRRGHYSRCGERHRDAPERLPARATIHERRLLE